ncbi:uncharacterized protein F5147DRAFT_841131 [Suillus discolor]|uniref:Uncharacterized protein n=1 Tax=Suillus discolor TaxID=1912936 RepID=A0A9P7JMT6_9AGAM|nr:uncharacterized protein F5147DRAFT_841131 [Suillus discolor]KAG2089450.1 hypothetical protein F5147DRAFT_841131 [Suillus discolor]
MREVQSPRYLVRDHCRTSSFKLDYLERAYVQSSEYLFTPFRPNSLFVTEIEMRPFFDIEPLSSFSPVWAYLTDVQIAVCHPNAVLHLLQLLCPNLSSLTLRIAFDQTEPLESFTHTKLQSLRILYDALLTCPLSDLLNALLPPNLRALEARRNASWPHKDMKALLARSKWSLESRDPGYRRSSDDNRRATSGIRYPHSFPPSSSGSQ